MIKPKDQIDERSEHKEYDYIDTLSSKKIIDRIQLHVSLYKIYRCII